MPFAILRPLESLQQHPDFVFPPDKRHQDGAMQRFETAFGLSFPLHAPEMERLGKAFERMHPDILELEQIAEEPTRRIGNHHLPGSAGGLKAGSKVRSFADDRTILCFAHTVDLASTTGSVEGSGSGGEG